MDTIQNDPREMKNEVERLRRKATVTAERIDELQSEITRKSGELREAVGKFNQISQELGRREYMVIMQHSFGKVELRTHEPVSAAEHLAQK